MSVQVTYDPDCDQNFRRLYHDQFQQWMNENHRFTIDGSIVGRGHPFYRCLILEDKCQLAI